jgi:predicted acetyltransferase
MGLKLIKLTKAYEKQLGEMIDEWKADQEKNHTNRSPGSIFKNDYHDFDYYLAHLGTKEPGNGKVPDSVFFLLDEERDRLLGAVNIRHYLNDSLYREGGHIGGGIRPSERRKGCATEMIRLALDECRKLGIERVLITCEKDNVGSAKSIMNNGGILENELVNEEGKIEQRYWIRNGVDPHAIDPKNHYLAYCGLDCETCEARLATVHNDDALRKKVAEKWSALNGIEITPEMINCSGCRIDGVKTVYCDSLCPIRQCALGKQVETCGGCEKTDSCETLALILNNSEDARRNLGLSRRNRI